MDIGKEIRKARKAKGLTLEALALQVDSNTGNLSRIETGKQGASQDLLKRIMSVLDMTFTFTPDNAEHITPKIKASKDVSATTTEPNIGGTIYWVPLISLSQASAWISGGYEMPDFDVEQYLPCAVPVGKRAFAFRMHNDSMTGATVERPILPGWAVYVDPDVTPLAGDLVLASIDGREPILGARTPHGGREFVMPANPRFDKEEIDHADPNWCLGRAVFVGFPV
jgi:SOS-response transcriptional repressor LexA